MSSSTSFALRKYQSHSKGLPAWRQNHEVHASGCLPTALPSPRKSHQRLNSTDPLTSMPSIHSQSASLWGLRGTCLDVWCKPVFISKQWSARLPWAECRVLYCKKRKDLKGTSLA
eukprot:1968550-Amphidinium_carterae.1